jgi:hypothetical protein
MDELRGANETRVAAGNMKVNARGDELGSGGHVVRNLAERARAAQQNVKQTKSNSSIKPSVTQAEKTIVQDAVDASPEVFDTASPEVFDTASPEVFDTASPEVFDTASPEVLEEFDTEGNITLKKTTRGKSKSESKSTEK